MLGCCGDRERGVAVKLTLAECRGAAISTGSYPESLARVLFDIRCIKTAGSSGLEN